MCAERNKQVCIEAHWTPPHHGRSFLNPPTGHHQQAPLNLKDPLSKTKVGFSHASFSLWKCLLAGSNSVFNGRDLNIWFCFTAQILWVHLTVFFIYFDSRPYQSRDLKWFFDWIVYWFIFKRNQVSEWYYGGYSSWNHLMAVASLLNCCFCATSRPTFYIYNTYKGQFSSSFILL